MVFNLVYIPAVEHYLRFFITAYSGTKDTPEFFAYAKLDDIHIGHCNTTGRAESQNEWERRFSQDHPKHNKDYVEKCEKVKNIFTGQIKNLNQQMNKTEGKSVCLEALVPKTHLRRFILKVPYYVMSPTDLTVPLRLVAPPHPQNFKKLHHVFLLVSLWLEQ